MVLQANYRNIILQLKAESNFAKERLFKNYIIFDCFSFAAAYFIPDSHTVLYIILLWSEAPTVTKLLVHSRASVCNKGYAEQHAHEKCSH